ncbi:MAG: triose-phosphate isomerase [Candidatus Nealsonbacteria bacterium]
MDKIFIIGNWKCNPTSLKKASNLFNSIRRGIEDVKNAEVVICPPFVYLSLLGAPSSARRRASYGGLAFGSQNCFREERGAFTGEISPLMLTDLGCKYVIIGHSERRSHLSEKDAEINKKLKAALKQNLRPILCIDKISQIKRGIKGILKSQIKKIIVAYEPIWAIGTGKACSFSQAKRFNLSIKKVLGKKHPVLYGGSVNSQNALGYIKESKFQGLLIGGASLKPKEFIKIVKLLSKSNY